MHFPVFAFCLYRRRHARLIGLASAWGIGKSVLLVGAVWLSGDYMDGLVSGGPAYHEDTLNWILRNEGKIAHPEVFTPEHIWRLGHLTLTATASAGLTSLVGGARELNVMNFHVGKLLQAARHPWRVALFGWPVWSLLRGWAYLLVIMGTAPLFFCIVKKSRPPYRRLCAYLVPGCALAGVDLGLKIVLAPAWRGLLASAF